MPAALNLTGIFHPGARPAGMAAAAPATTTTTAGTTNGGKGAAPPAAPFDWAAYAKSVFAPIDYSNLAKIASGRAASDTDALVAGYKTLQSDALTQAAARATQQGQLGLASSKYLEGLNLGGLAAGDYASAAAAERAAAAGYSGGLQQTVSDAAAKVQANLAAAGSPQTALNQGAAAGNALYGLGGNLPALQLDAIGPTVAAGLRALPAQTLGYGQQLAFGELGAGQQEASKLNAEIVTARAKQGALAASYLDKLSEVARQSGQDKIANYYKAMAIKMKEDALKAQGNQIDAAASKVIGHIVYKDGTEPTDPKGNVIPIAAGPGKSTYRNDAYGRLLQIAPDGSITVRSEGHWTDSAGATWRVGLDGKQTLVSTKPVTPHTFGSATSGYYTIDPNTGKVVQLKEGTGPTPHYTTYDDGTNTYTVDRDTGQKWLIGPSKPSTAGTSTSKDPFGRPVRYNADGSQTIMGPGLWENPVTHATYTVGIDGTFTPFSKGKQPKPPKPYAIPQGTYDNAQKVAALAFGATATIGSGAFATTIAGSGKRKSYQEAFRRVTAYLHGALPPSQYKLIVPAATAILVSVGYPSPETKIPGYPGGSVYGPPLVTSG
jgi:hypothetical protein